MLLILTILLVLAGIVLLAIGLVQDKSSYIYVSMGCAVVAALILFVYHRLTRRAFASGGALAPAAVGGGVERTAAPPAPEPVRAPSPGPGADPATGEGYPALATRPPESSPPPLETTGTAPVTTPPAPAPSAPSSSAPPPVAAPPVAASAGTSASTASAGADDDLDDDLFDDHDEGFDDLDDDLAEPPASPAATAAAPPAPVATGPTPPPPAAGTSTIEEGDPWGDDEGFVFPIEDYDDLRVSEILPILSELEPDELVDVRDRERASKARGTILRRIESLLTDVPGGVPASAARPAPAAASHPIADYSSLRVAEILPRLAELSPSELDAVEQEEQAGAARTTVLNRIRRLRAEGPATVGAAPVGAPSGSAAPASSTPAKKKAAAKKAPAKKSDAAKRAAAARKADATKKGSAKKAAGKKASAAVSKAKPAGATDVPPVPDPDAPPPSSGAPGAPSEG